MDTVILTIPGPGRFKIKHLSWYVPELISRTYRDLSPTERQSLRPYLKRFTFRPPKQDRYRPRIEIFEALTEDKKDMRYILKIEFSVPKLLYGNSIQEVRESDKEKVFNRLRSALLDAGILIETSVIAKASVSAAHFCKNVLLPKKMQLREILNELIKVDISKVVDISDTRFKKGGRVLNIYSGTIERSIYDKISDSTRPKNKRTDKARINRERNFVERHGLQDSEIFRYEYRIKKTATVKRELNSVLERDGTKLVVFSDLFTPSLFQKIVNKSWRDIVSRPANQLALLGPVDKLNLFLHILSEAGKQGGAHSMNNGLISYGLTVAIIEHGAKEVKGVISSRWNGDHTERLTKKIETASLLAKGLPYSNCISFVSAALEKFEPIGLSITPETE